MIGDTKISGAERVARAMCVAFWRGKLESIQATTAPATFEAIIKAASEVEFHQWEASGKYIFNEGH